MLAIYSATTKYCEIVASQCQIQRTALFNAERNGLWRCTGASSLEDGAKVLEKRAIRTLGVEGVRGLARARLANRAHVCSNSTGSRGLIADARRPITKTHGRPITRDLGLVHSTGRAADNTPPSLEVRSRWLVSRIVTEDWVKFREN